MNVVTVSQINTFIKSLLDGEKRLFNIYIVGEISNFVCYNRSGHIYLTLKDDKSQIKAVMFSSYASRLKFTPENGMRVICRGRVSCYEKDGSYQLYIEDMQPDGAGALAVAYEQLKSKLEAEGLFEQSIKKPLPKYPKKIGVATSNSGAAIEDIKNITKRRFPLCELVIVPTVVQGENAPTDIISSLKILDCIDDIDLIIVGRGGGSAEDLWAFNDENVVRTVAGCNKPVISAVGHETDFTLCDFAADLRAPTPSAAAEIAVPDSNTEFSRLKTISDALSRFLKFKLENELMRFDSVLNSRLFEAREYFDDKAEIFKELSQDLGKAYASVTDAKMQKLTAIAGKLNALSPLSVLARGYCAASDCNGNAITDIESLNVGDRLCLTIKNGKAYCTVDEVIYE